ncbi:hypothetical protein [Streptomyces sp. NPDC007264]|uniref:hypothetical protein n=1 Tax=Streptomyces sp. NPDC007264 TaxID=3364777 RepID=UPI0036DB84AF
MLRATWLRGRRRAVVGASAVLACLAGLPAACAGGAGRDGYVAVGPAGGAPAASGTAVAPTGDVTLVPLQGQDRPGGAGGHGSRTAESAGSSTASGDAPSGGSSAGAPGGGPGGTPGTGGAPGGTSASPPATAPAGADPGPSSPTPTPSRTTPAGPAVLSVGEPVREATDQRWCENVTVSFGNAGGSAVGSGTVTFGTHIIGALGIDWATIESTWTLPAPIAAGATVKKTWTVCVDAWRVPLGMHIETRDVSVRWA